MCATTPSVGVRGSFQVGLQELKIQLPLVSELYPYFSTSVASPGSEKSHGIRALSISASRRYLAVSECGEKATITVFDLQHEQGRKRKVLTAGDTPVQEFVCMAFSPDSKYLIGQTGAPQWMLIFWLWEKHKVVATVKTTNSNNPVNQVSLPRCMDTAAA